MTDFEAILDQAHMAASAAIQAKYDAGEREQPFNCGFAWVTIDGREPLARYCRKIECGPLTPHAQASGLTNNSRYGSRGEPGWRWWKPGKWPRIPGVPSYQQDMDFHVAAATAFQKVLADHGIRANVGSRLD